MKIIELMYNQLFTSQLPDCLKDSDIQAIVNNLIKDGKIPSDIEYPLTVEEFSSFIASVLLNNSCNDIQKIGMLKRFFSTFHVLSDMTVENLLQVKYSSTFISFEYADNTGFIARWHLGEFDKNVKTLPGEWLRQLWYHVNLN